MRKMNWLNCLNFKSADLSLAELSRREKDHLLTYIIANGT